MSENEQIDQRSIVLKGTAQELEILSALAKEYKRDRAENEPPIEQIYTQILLAGFRFMHEENRQ